MGVRIAMRALVIGGTSGIGNSIYNHLKPLCNEAISTGRKEIDTTSLESTEKYLKSLKDKKFDILVLNTGGPQDINFDEISNNEWIENFNRLFLSFINIIKKIEMNKNGYIFLVSSYIIKEPSDSLVISSSIRTGFVSLFKSLSKLYEKKKISFINLAPGPVKTKRLENLLKAESQNFDDFAKTMPHENVPKPDELGLFVQFVVKNKIKSFNGVTIPFDSGLLKSI